MTFEKLWLCIFLSCKITLRFVLLKRVLFRFLFFSFIVDAPAIVNQGLVNIYFTQVPFFFFNFRELAKLRRLEVVFTVFQT